MLRLAAIGIAILSFLLGAMAAGMPNARQPAWAAGLFAYGAIILVLVGLSFASPLGQTLLRWFLIATIGLALVAYALPQSFWAAVGLREAPPGMPA
jgi:peptidoglycan/LPS O-acetylase OafA/YrhL